MTDYLEQLLEQPEQEDEPGLEWPKTTLRSWAVQQRSEAQGAAAEVRERELPYTAPAVVGQEETMSLIRQLDKLHRSARRAEEPAKRRAAGGVASVQAEVGGAGFGVQLSPHAAADYAALVDAAFQRDARRYDGPLGLL